MKKKGTAGKIQLSAVKTLFVAATLVVLALRVYQFFQNAVRPEDGAWATESLTAPLLYALIALSAAALLLLPFLSANLPKSVLPQQKSKPLALAGLLLLFGLIADAVTQLSSAIANHDASGKSFGVFLRESGLLPNLLQIIFGLFAALYLLLFTLSYWKGKNLYTSSKILALAPTAWVIARLISRFMRPANFLNNTELFFELVMLCFVMIFFFIFSRITSQLSHKGKMWALFGCGFPAAMLALLCSVPRLVLMFAGREDLRVESSPLEYADLAVSAFIVLLLFTLVREYMAGNYARYDEDDATFGVTVRAEEALAPVGEVVPPTFTAPAAGAENDEAFEIAAQYSNQYLQTSAPAEDTAPQEGKDPEEPEKSEDAEESAEE